MTNVQADICAGMLKRIEEIDKKFERATGWGSWMVEVANEREQLVNDLHQAGVLFVQHKYQARCNGRRTD